MDPLIVAWARAFVFTQLVEVPIYRTTAKVPLALAFAASAVTHPIVWFVFFSQRFTLGYDMRLVAAETFAVLAEATMMATRLPWSRAFAVALLANGSSVVLGEVCRFLWGFP